MAVGVWQVGRFTRLLWMVSRGCVRLPTWQWWCSPPSPSQRSSLWSCCDPCVSHKPHHKVPWVHRFPQTEYCYLKRQIITNLLLITESFFKMKYSFLYMKYIYIFYLYIEMNIFWGNRFKSGQDKSMGLEVIITNRFSSDTDETSGVPRERTPHQNVIVSTFIECFCLYTWFYELIYFKSKMKWAHLLLINQDWLRKGQRTVQLKNCWWSMSTVSLVSFVFHTT